MTRGTAVVPAAAVAVALLLGACSGVSADAPGPTAPGVSPGRTIAPSEAAALAVASASAAPSAKGSSDPFAPTPEPSDDEGLVGEDGRTIPSSSAKPGSKVTFAPAPEDLAKRFNAVAKSAGSVIGSGQYRLVAVSGKTSGGMAVYAVTTPAASSTVFQDQFAVQLLNALAADSRPKIVRIQGKAVAVSTGKTPAAAWFDGTKVVLVLREGATTTESLAASVIAHAAKA